jgi:hypothetical protein
MKLHLFLTLGLLHLFQPLIRGQFTPPQYLASQDYQKTRDLRFVMKYEANTILRDNAYFFNHFGTAAEFKLAERVSLNTTFRAFRQSQLVFQNESVPNPTAWQWQTTVEPRWHWENERGNYKDSTTNPFFGNYLGARLQADWGFRQEKTTISTFLTFGTERFYYSSPFHNIDNALDASIGIGLVFKQTGTVRPAFQILVIQGLILNNLLPKYRKNNQPPKRFTENLLMTDKNSLFKIDLVNLITKADDGHLIGEINMAYEQKIAKSPFSINLISTFNPFFLTQTPPSVKSQKTLGSRWAVGIEPRWYFDLNKRIRKGESGNNLSGYYISTEFLYQNQSIERSLTNGKIATTTLKNLTLTPTIGTQHRLSRWMVYDFRMGLGARTVQDAERRWFNNYESVIFADVLLGVAF